MTDRDRFTNNQFIIMALIAAVSSGGSHFATKYIIADQDLKVLDSVIENKINRTVKSSIDLFRPDPFTGSEGRTLLRRIERLEKDYDYLLTQSRRQQEEIHNLLNYKPHWQEGVRNGK